MNLSQLTAEAQLIKITIDDEKIVEKYGETIDFWMYDRQDIDVYMQLSEVDKDKSNVVELANITRKLVLTEQGEPILGPNKMLPFDIMIQVISSCLEKLGNESTQTSTA
jgi:hypothetical protein